MARCLGKMLSLLRQSKTKPFDKLVIIAPLVESNWLTSLFHTHGLFPFTIQISRRYTHESSQYRNNEYVIQVSRMAGSRLQLCQG